MSNEFSIMVIIAATLIVLSLVCGVIFFGVSQSRDIANQGHTAITDTVNLTDVIMSVQRNGNMPAAASYTILKEHPELIVRLFCFICGRITIGLEVGDCIKNHLHGRVYLTLNGNGDGTFIATLTGG